MTEENDTGRKSFGGLRFTPSGQKKMEEYQARFAQVLRQSIREQRTTFTETIIEVTAADVDRALDGVKLVSTKKLEFRRLIYDLYASLGILVACSGIFYDKISKIFHDQPERLSLILLGIFATLLSILGRRMYKVIRIGRNSSSGLVFSVSDFDESSDRRFHENIMFYRNMLAHNPEGLTEEERHDAILKYKMSLKGPKYS
jgi:hypothetical protein